MIKKSLSLDLTPYQVNGVIHVGAGKGAYANYYHKLGINKVLWLEKQGHLYRDLYSNTCQYGMEQKILMTQLHGEDAPPLVKKLLTVWRENASYLDMDTYDMLHVACQSGHLQILQGCDFLLDNFKIIVFSSGHLSDSLRTFLSEKGYDEVMWVAGVDATHSETLYVKR